MGSGLIEVLDALVKRDPAPAGFSGEVAVGVRGVNGAYRFWVGTFGARVRSRISLARPRTSQATLYLDEASAHELLAAGTLPDPPALLMIEGDRSLMSKFIQRYTSKTDWLGIRLR